MTTPGLTHTAIAAPSVAHHVDSAVVGGRRGSNGRGGVGSTALELALPLAAGGVALAVSAVSPLLGPLLVGLALGAAAVNLPHGAGVVARVTSATGNRRLLRLGVALLGLKVVATDLADIGWLGAAVIGATVGVTFGSTLVFGRLLGLPRELTTLIAAGFSICGAAAIAATETTIGARAKDVALAVGLVTMFGTTMILLLPVGAHGLGLTHQQAALWAGASIHEVAQVIAAASLVGGGAAVVTVATTVKLGRVVMLAPVQLLIGAGTRRADRAAGVTGRSPLVPMFVLGFLGMVALRSTGLLPVWAVDDAGTLTTLLLSAAMFGLGTGIRVRELWPVPARVLALASCSTLVATAVPLVLIEILDRA